MITTIQLNNNVKKELERLKQSKKETYEEVILNLMKFMEQYKRRKKELLIEECKVMAKDNLKTVKEWESIDNELAWEY